MDSIQQKLKRLRPGRVQITYDVETAGSVEKKELPYVVGVIANLSNSSSSSVKPYEFINIDKDNFGDILKNMAATISLKVPQYKNTNTNMEFCLNIEKIEDFKPINIIQKIEALSKMRSELSKISALYAKLELSPELQDAFCVLCDNCEQKTNNDSNFKATTERSTDNSFKTMTDNSNKTTIDNSQKNSDKGAKK